MEYAQTQFFPRSPLIPDDAPEPQGRRRPRRTSAPPLVDVDMHIGDYKIVELIGRGGFGSVWRGIDTRPQLPDGVGRDVAIKIMRSEYLSREDIVARFEREASVVAMMDHPHIVRLREFDQLHDGTPYIVMEYLVGTGLHTQLDRRGVFSCHETLEMLEQLGEALSAAHAHGVIHRDIKASNIMLCDRPDGTQRLVLLDFGIAKLLESRDPPITAPLATVGSPHFMAPEQVASQQVDARTDVYGLGVLAFQLLTGELPFQGDLCAVLCAHLENERPAPSQYDESLRGLDAVIQRAMARRPSHRFATVDEFVAAFRDAVTVRRGGRLQPDARAAVVPAVGIYVQTDVDFDASAASCGGYGSASSEDAAMDDAARVQGRARRFLLRRGYVVAYEHGNVSLLVLPIHGDEAAARRRAIGVAGDLRLFIAHRPDAHSWVATDVHIDVGTAKLRRSCGISVEGGSLVDNAPPSICRLHSRSGETSLRMATVTAP